ncbi:hypothetical protein AT15_00535 [Kosmotoga arenicorallina S304]|uniref:PD-(D/E)XK endonuclease-like domain-containing protein n=1 Tax=Kosmotoga arenicorallina S304 TaxID=1453497 RepID=A0A176K0K9_9BACT|nr:PD-(D/E)XK nuclease family protein [Kosmotoga arenicorallina]OAA30034.1 hypothetical protein AT15_00535 [Kosmotoga arenicorallina S304]
MDYPEKSWSLSKQKLFEECKRKYYYKTFLSWKGWQSGASELERKAYLLSKLQNIYTISGQALHEEIKTAILEKSFSPKDSFERIRSRLREAWIDSSKHLQDWQKWPKEYIVLSELYYGNEDWLRKNSKDILKRIKTSLLNFQKSFSFRRVLRNEVKAIEVDENFPSFFFEGIRVYSVIDFLHQDTEGNITIVDWKTGQKKPERDAFQLGLYVIYVLEKYPAVKLSMIKCVDEYLLSGERAKYRFTPEQIGALREYISRSIRELDKYLEDPAANKPKDISAFPRSRSKNCNYCEFKEICFAEES